MEVLGWYGKFLVGKIKNAAYAAFSVRCEIKTPRHGTPDEAGLS